MLLPTASLLMASQARSASLMPMNLNAPGMATTSTPKALFKFDKMNALQRTRNQIEYKALQAHTESLKNLLDKSGPGQSFNYLA